MTRAKSGIPSRAIRQSWMAVALCLSVPATAADDYLVNVIMMESDILVRARVHNYENREKPVIEDEYFDGEVTYGVDPVNMGFKWEKRCRGEIDGARFTECDMVSEQSGPAGQMLTKKPYGLDHATATSNDAAAHGFLNANVTDHERDYFRIAGHVGAWAQVTPSGAHTNKRARVRARLRLDIIITRPSKVLISNCSLFDTGMLPITHLNDHRNICGFEITDVSAGMSLLQSLFEDSLGQGDGAPQPGGIGGPLGEETEFQWRMAQEARIREHVEGLGCEALLSAGYLDSCGPTGKEVDDARLEAIWDLIDSIVERTTCDTLLDFGFIEACGPGPVAIAVAREAKLQDWVEEIMSRTSCQVLLDTGYVSTCDPEPEDIESSRFAYRTDLENAGRERIDQWNCERLMNEGYLESCHPDPDEWQEARLEYGDYLFDGAELLAEGDSTELPGVDASELERIREMQIWSCNEAQAAGYIENCQPKSGELRGTEALESAKNAMFIDMMEKLDSQQECSELLWQGAVTGCEFAGPDQGGSDDGFIPDDFQEDRVPADQHETYEKNRKSGQSLEDISKMMAQVSFLDSIMEGAAVHFVIKHPKYLDENFDVEARSPSDGDDSLKQMLEERFVIEIRALD